MNEQKTFTLALKYAKQISPKVLHLAFERVDGQAFSFIPGQFITFHFAIGDKILRRSYSIATISERSTDIELAASYVNDGAATQLLFNLQKGDTVEATGPVGRLILQEETPKRYILVATGTGVTPYRAMLPQLIARLQAHEDLNVEIVLGVQGPEYALYEDDFLAYAAQHPRLKFSIYYSRQQPPHLRAHEYAGHVQESFTRLAPHPNTDWVYLCGAPGMIDDWFERLKTVGFTASQVRREKYISPN